MWVVTRITGVHVRVRMRLPSSRVGCAGRAPAVLSCRLLVHVVHCEAGMEHGIVLVHQVMSLLLGCVGSMGMVRGMVVM